MRVLNCGIEVLADSLQALHLLLPGFRLLLNLLLPRLVAFLGGPRFRIQIGLPSLGTNWESTAAAQNQREQARHQFLQEFSFVAMGGSRNIPPSVGWQAGTRNATKVVSMAQRCHHLGGLLSLLSSSTLVPCSSTFIGLLLQGAGNILQGKLAHEAETAPRAIGSVNSTKKWSLGPQGEL